MCVWFSQKEVITFKSLLVKQHFADGMQGFLKEASCFFCGCWLGFSPLSSILTVEQADWSCRYHSPGVEPWLIVTFWPFLDFPAKVFLTFPIPLAESGMFGWADAWDPYASPPTLTFSSRYEPPLLDLQEQCHSSCIRTDPNSVPFLDIAKYSPLLTDLMATTPTLTDRISIRPEKKKEGTTMFVRNISLGEFPY